jgi:hypothetical protein
VWRGFYHAVLVFWIIIPKIKMPLGEANGCTWREDCLMFPTIQAIVHTSQPDSPSLVKNVTCA